MHIYLGSDHGGFALKEACKALLQTQYPDFVIEDCGAFVLDADDDYPEFAFQVAHKTVAKLRETQALGILFCRSGSGMVIAANKVEGTRAVELYDETIAVHAKSHNHANVIALSGDYLDQATMMRLIELFLQTTTDPHERHARRIAQIIAYEQKTKQGSL